MTQLAIKGHKTRGEEVIALLEMLGGKNIFKLFGIEDSVSYWIGGDDIIHCWDVKSGSGLTIFTLEQFEREFPYKVGDEVRLGVPDEVRITNMYWDSCSDQVIYEALSVNGGREYDCLNASQLSPCKEQTSPDKAKAPSLEGQDYSEGRCGYKIPDGFEFEKVENDEIILKPKGLPKSYKECFKILYGNYHHVVYVAGLDGLGNAKDLFESFIKLKICRDSYWKLAGDWEPVHQSGKDNTFYTIHRFNNEIIKSKTSHRLSLLEFPNEEMRDTFYENFKELINECKELL